jgi:enterochelin esterase-like enzyme
MAKLKSIIKTACLFFCSLLLSTWVFAQGDLQQIKVHSPSLEGNLNGDSAERDVYVYLPPGYEDSGRRYPVIYFLHGYGVGAEIYVNGVLRLPGSVDEAMAAGAQEFILVMPDAFNKYSGSMYSNSPTIGDWESWIAKDLVSYIDSHYRTLPQRESRGLSGHSMGGYGTLRIGMKAPEVFGALYAMSSCCLLNNAPPQERVQTELVRMAEGIEGYKMGSFENAMLAQASAWAPNPDNPPYYLDLPYSDGAEQPLVSNKWTANSPLVFVDQYVPALSQYRGIFLDVGNEDGLEATNTQLDAALTRLGVDHGYEVYAGDHGNRVGQRFIDNVLPFFTRQLLTQ